MHPSSGRLRPGHVLDGSYELLEPLGRGGAGVVYRARDVAGREVALKTLLAAGGLSPRQEERFRREGQIAAQLDHPGIVRVHGSGMTPAGPYLVYELVEGARSLSEAAADLDAVARARLVRDAAQALGYAHARGVVHRDVKPDNLLVDAAGRVRITDFGAALGEGQERLTLTGGMVGTPYYMAPEQLSTEREELGPGVDVWGLGVVLYGLLTDAQPFPAQHMGELYALIQEAQPTPPRRLNPEVPRPLAAVCLRALRRDPSRRYADGAAFAAAIDAALSGPRRVGGRAVLGVAAATAALSLGAAVLLGGAGGPPPAPQEPLPSRAPTEGPPAEGRPAEGRPASTDEASADEALDRLRDLEEPLARYRAARAWLARYDAHPGAREVRQVRDRLLRSPLLSLSVPHVRRARFLDDETLALACEGGARIHPLGGEAPRARSPAGSPLTGDLSVSADGQRLAYVAGGRWVWVCDAPWGEGRLLELPRAVGRVALSPDGRRLVTGSPRGVTLYSAQDGTLLRKLEPRDPCNAVTIGPEGWIVCAWERYDTNVFGLRVWSPEGEWLQDLSMEAKHDVLAVASDAQTLLAGSPDGALKRLRRTASGWSLDGRFVHADAEHGDGFVSNLAHRRRVTGAAFLGADRALSVSGGEPRRGVGRVWSAPNEARLWDVRTGAHLATGLTRLPRFTDVAASPDGALFAVVLPDEGTLEVWATAHLDHRR